MIQHSFRRSSKRGNSSVGQFPKVLAEALTVAVTGLACHVSQQSDSTRSEIAEITRNYPLCYWVRSTVRDPVVVGCRHRGCRPVLVLVRGKILEDDGRLVFPHAVIRPRRTTTRRQPPSYDRNLLHGLAVDHTTVASPATVRLVYHEAYVRLVRLGVVVVVLLLDGPPSAVEHADENNDEDEEGDSHT